LDDPAYIDGVLRDGADRAQAMAAPILRDVQDIVGFLRP
jgi:tryptophanyl-tRNA synthetase